MSVFAFFGINPSKARGRCVVSPCGLYRYRLERLMAEKPEGEDQTTMKWRGFTARNGGERFIVGNPFAYSATSPKELATVADPVGPDNHIHLKQIIAESDILIPCWGNRAKVPKKLWPHFYALMGLLTASGKPLKCFGLTASGDPMHPLMLGYDTQLQEWKP